jgi:hypothetical protein
VEGVFELVKFDVGFGLELSKGGVVVFSGFSSCLDFKACFGFRGLDVDVIGDGVKGVLGSGGFPGDEVFISVCAVCGDEFVDAC